MFGGIIRDIILVLAIIVLAYSYTTDRSVKDLFDNPPAAVGELINDGSTAVTEGVNEGMSRIEQATDEAAATE